MLEDTGNIEINSPLERIKSIPGMLSIGRQILRFPYILRRNPGLLVYGIKSQQSQILSHDPSCDVSFITPKNPGKMIPAWTSPEKMGAVSKSPPQISCVTRTCVSLMLLRVGLGWDGRGREITRSS